jgi:hypothetical protein
MAFTPETGTGLPDSNAYMTVEEFKAHHTDRGVAAATDGTFTDAEIQAFIVQATDYLDKRFGLKFRGWKAKDSQALQWPRTDAYDNGDYLITGVPRQLKKACAEYALIAGQLGRNLAPLPGTGFSTIDPATGTETGNKSSIKREKEAVGPIETEVEYGQSTDMPRPMQSSGNIVQRIPDYPQADLWVEEIITAISSREVYRG